MTFLFFNLSPLPTAARKAWLRLRCATPRQVSLLRLGVVTKRQLLPVFLGFIGIILTGCSRAPHFEFTDTTSITFTNRDPMQREGLNLGARSRVSFIQTVTQPESDFDPKWLELSAPMGVFQTGNTQFEYHLGLVVYRDGRRVHIWQSDFSHQLGDALLKTNACWREMLEK